MYLAGCVGPGSAEAGEIDWQAHCSPLKSEHDAGAIMLDLSLPEGIASTSAFGQAGWSLGLISLRLSPRKSLGPDGCRLASYHLSDDPTAQCRNGSVSGSGFGFRFRLGLRMRSGWGGLPGGVSIT